VATARRTSERASAGLGRWSRVAWPVLVAVGRSCPVRRGILTTAPIARATSVPRTGAATALQRTGDNRRREPPQRPLTPAMIPSAASTGVRRANQAKRRDNGRGTGSTGGPKSSSVAMLPSETPFFIARRRDSAQSGNTSPTKGDLERVPLAKTSPRG